MTSAKIPNRTVRGIRDTIPPGYVLGRAAGDSAGPAQLIPLAPFATQAYVAVTTIANGAAVSGDLSGDLPGPLTVTGIQGTPVSAANPTNGQALVFNGTDWVPTTLTTTQYGSVVFDGSDVYFANVVSLADPELVFAGGIPTYTKNPVVALQGVVDGSDAAAGKIGEYISSEVIVASGVPLMSAANTDITSIVLTAGDWDVEGNVGPTTSSGLTVFSQALGWISTVSATIPTLPNKGAFYAQSVNMTAGAGCIFSVGKIRLSLTAPTTVFLSINTTFSPSGSVVGYGFIGARRVR